MSFELRGHTADVAVAARGASLGEAFAAAADGLAAAMSDTLPDIGERFAVEVGAESREALLFEYLDRLIYERDVRAVLPVDNETTVSETGGRWELTGSARGVPLEAVNGREIKAVTYSEMRVEPADDGWEIYVVLDV